MSANRTIQRVVQVASRVVPFVHAALHPVLLRGMEDVFIGRSHEVFHIGQANEVPAWSSELAVSLEGGAHVEAVDRIIRIASRQWKRYGFHTSPIALRFVAPSKALASMMYGRPTMMIELILSKGTVRGFELLRTYETELADLDVRPHWGQYNVELHPQRLYPRWDRWMEVYAECNASGVFDSPLTDRLGISRGPRA